MSTCLCSVCFWKMSSIGNVSCTCIFWFAKCIHHLRLCNNFLQSAYIYIDTLCYLYTLYEVSIYLYFMIYNLIWIFKMGVLSVIFAADENIMCGFFYTMRCDNVSSLQMQVVWLIVIYRKQLFFIRINVHIVHTIICILWFVLILWFIKPNTEESSVIICLEQLRKAWFAHLLVGSLIPWTFATTWILFHILALKILLPQCYNVL